MAQEKITLKSLLETKNIQELILPSSLWKKVDKKIYLMDDDGNVIPGKRKLVETLPPDIYNLYKVE
ncbi:MAG: hypothetical protein ABIJ47_13830 [Candidatus Bathyarchaeota archaeon]